MIARLAKPDSGRRKIPANSTLEQFNKLAAVPRHSRGGWEIHWRGFIPGQSHTQLVGQWIATRGDEFLYSGCPGGHGPFVRGEMFWTDLREGQLYICMEDPGWVGVALQQREIAYRTLSHMVDNFSTLYVKNEYGRWVTVEEFERMRAFQNERPYNRTELSNFKSLEEAVRG